MAQAAVRYDGFDGAARLSARQFALAGAVSLLVHAGAAAVVLAPDYEEARLAGGGASFGLSGGRATNVSGTGTSGTDGASDRMATADVDAPQARQDETEAPSREANAGAAPDAPNPPDAADAPDHARDPVPPETRDAPAKPPPALRSDQIPAQTESEASVAAPTAQSAAPRKSAARRDETGGRPKASRPADRRRGPSARSAERSTARQAADRRSQGRSRSGSGSGTGSAESGAGDAARTNYTGLVTEHIRRNRRSNAVGAGQAIVKLTIAPDGGLRDLDIYRSSGSTRFDRQALRMARLAAPYPRPPAGQGPVLVRLRGR